VRQDVDDLGGGGGRDALVVRGGGVRPKGWREAAGEFGDAKTHRSVADITDGKSLEKVRSYKKQMKARAKAQAS